MSRSKVIYTYRLSWADVGGDLEVDGQDLGWHTLADAEAVAAERGVALEKVVEADYEVKHRRRES